MPGDNNLEAWDSHIQSQHANTKNTSNEEAVASIMDQKDFSRVSYSDNQLSEIADKGIDPFDAYQNNFDLNKELYERQSGREALTRAVTNGLHKGLYSVAENTGYMLDIPQWFQNFDKFDNDTSNWLSEWAAEQKQEISDEAPIYSEDMWDFGFWAQMTESTVDSGLGFALPGAGAGKLIGTAGKAVAKILQAKKGIDAARAMNITSRVATSMLTNYAESQMMGQELYKNIYNEAIKKGVDAEEAKRVANEEKHNFRMSNLFNVATDYITLGRALGPKAALTGGAQKGKLGLGKELAKQMSGEAFEEVTGDFLQKEAERRGGIKLGTKKKDDSSFLGRAFQFAVSDEGITSAVGGLMGGPAQSLMTGGASKLAKASYDKMGWSELEKELGEYKGNAPTLDEHGLTSEDLQTMDPKLTLKDHLLTIKPELKNDPVKLSKALDDHKTAYAKYSQDYDKLKSEREGKSHQVKKYKEALKRHEGNKKAHDDERDRIKKDNEKRLQARNTGKIEQTKRDVSNFISQDVAFEAEYLDALENADVEKMKAVESERFENMFIRYANKQAVFQEHKGDGSLETRLLAYAEDENATEEQRKNATKALSKLEDLSDQYYDLFKRHSDKPQTMQRAWETRSRINALEEVSEQINNKEEKITSDIIKSIEKTGGEISTSDMEAVKLTREIKGLSKALEVESRLEGVKNRLNNRKKELESKLSKIETPNTKLILQSEKLDSLYDLLSKKQDVLNTKDFYSEYYKRFTKEGSKELLKENKNLIQNTILKTSLEHMDIIPTIISSRDLNPKDREFLLDVYSKRKEFLERQEVKNKETLERAKIRRKAASQLKQQLVSLRDIENKGEDNRKADIEQQEAIIQEQDEIIKELDSEFNIESEIVDDAILEFDRKLEEGLTPTVSDTSELSKETDNEEVRNAALNAVADNNVNEPIKEPSIAPRHLPDGDNQLSISPTINDANDSNKEASDLSLAYISGTDNDPYWINNSDSAIADWVENPAVNGVGHSMSIEVDPEFDSKDPNQRGYRYYVLNKEGNKIKLGGKYVYGWLRVPKGDSPSDKALKSYRSKLDKELKQGTLDKNRPKIDYISNGVLMQEKGLRNNILEKLNKEGKDLTLTIKQGVEYIESLSDEGGVSFTKEDGKTLTSKNEKGEGFLHAMIKTASGKDFPLRMNSRKLNESEVDAIYNIYKDFFKGASSKSRINSKHIKGNISYKEALDLLIFEGPKSIATDYPIFFEFKDKKAKTPSRLILGDNLDSPITDIVAEEQRVKDYLSKMWRTHQMDMINKDMQVKGEIEWFDSKINSSTHYNEFLFNEGAASTNAVIPQGIFFTRPIIRLNDSSEWGFSKGSKSKVKVTVPSENAAFTESDGGPVLDFNKIVKSKSETQQPSSSVEVKKVDSFKEQQPESEPARRRRSPGLKKTFNSDSTEEAMTEENCE